LLNLRSRDLPFAVELEEAENVMTKQLEKAFSEVSKLPAKDQDAIAEIVLAELASEQRWNDLFTNSQDLLAKLASEALAEQRASKTQAFSYNNYF
jgi:TRAP-type C4-dicarboxylate transport system substrate-binding protein